MKPLARQDLIKKSRQKLQDFSFPRLVPNMVTILALCVGLSSIRFAMQGNVEYAVAAVLLAAFFDAMDGRLARLLNVSSDFGAELDSLSDFISFGVGPGLTLYILVMQKLGNLGWGLVLFFSVCMGLRLARFNTMLRANPDKPKPDWQRKFFVGVPAPAGAMIAFMPLVAYLATGIETLLDPVFTASFMFVSGALMVSRLPTFSFKSHQIARKHVLPFMVGAGLIIVTLVTEPWLTLMLSQVAYLVSLPLSYRTFRRLRALGGESAPKP
ncbi:MAG: CDP-alcohol phosphatidyltransferase family protein [Holosporales bacterium]